MTLRVLANWTFIFTCCLFLISCTVTLPPDLWHTGYSEYTLRQIVRGDSCSSDCWQDIEPGVSTLSDVDDLLRRISIHPYIGRNIENGSPISHSWEYPETLLLPDDSERMRHVIVSFAENGRVLRVLVSVDLCISTVINEYGIPRLVLESIYETPSLVYPQEHLYFTTDSDLRIDRVVKTAGEDDLPNGTEMSWESFSTNMLDKLCTDAFSNEDTDNEVD